MKAATHRAVYALFLIPALAGAAAVWLVLASARSATGSNEVEGTLFAMAFVGFGASVILPPFVAAIGAYALRVCRVPFVTFFAAMLVGLAPVAYFQCVNVQSSLLLAAFTQGDSQQLTVAYPRLVAEALMLFGAATLALSAAIYRLIAFVDRGASPRDTSLRQ